MNCIPRTVVADRKLVIAWILIRRIKEEDTGKPLMGEKWVFMIQGSCFGGTTYFFV